MKDGVYLVDTYNAKTGFTISAAFVVERGIITRCAPILRKRLDYWKTIAKRYEPTT